MQPYVSLKDYHQIRRLSASRQIQERDIYHLIYLQNDWGEILRCIKFLYTRRILSHLIHIFLHLIPTIFILLHKKEVFYMYVEIKDVHKSFLKDNEQMKVLDNINLSIEKGSFVSIVGPSGCGKSTLLNLIAGLDQVDEGAIYVNDEQVTKPGPDRVVVFQSDGLFPWLTVLDNVTYGLKLNGMKKEKAEEKALEYLQMVHLSKYVDSYPHQLSGGMKRRVAIARALVMEPDI